METKKRRCATYVAFIQKMMIQVNVIMKIDHPFTLLACLVISRFASSGVDQILRNEVVV